MMGESLLFLDPSKMHLSTKTGVEPRNYTPDEGKYCSQCPFYIHGFCAVKCPFSAERRNTAKIYEYLLDKYGTDLFKGAEAFIRKYDVE